MKKFIISQSDVRLLKWAIGLSIGFTFVDFTFSLGIITLSLGYCIVALLLCRISPIPECEAEIDPEKELNPVGLQDFHEWLSEDPARKHLSKNDQKRAFQNQRYNLRNE